MDWTTILLAGGPIAASVALWAARLEGKLNTHIAEDKIVHEMVATQLDKLDKKTDRMDEKLDRLVSRRRD